eukprot:scaffold5287_cov345-Prasinococcus_capsulatus_cf.AAC.7
MAAVKGLGLFEENLLKKNTVWQLWARITVAAAFLYPQIFPTVTHLDINIAEAVLEAKLSGFVTALVEAVRHLLVALLPIGKIVAVIFGVIIVARVTLGLFLELLPALFLYGAALFGGPRAYKPVRRQRTLLLLEDETDADLRKRREEKVSTLRDSFKTRHGVGYNLECLLAAKTNGVLLTEEELSRYFMPLPTNGVAAHKLNKPGSDEDGNSLVYVFPNCTIAKPAKKDPNNPAIPSQFEYTRTYKIFNYNLIVRVLDSYISPLPTAFNYVYNLLFRTSDLLVERGKRVFYRLQGLDFPKNYSMEKYLSLMGETGSSPTTTILRIFVSIAEASWNRSVGAVADG